MPKSIFFYGSKNKYSKINLREKRKTKNKKKLNKNHLVLGVLQGISGRKKNEEDKPEKGEIISCPNQEEMNPVPAEAGKNSKNAVWREMFLVPGGR